MELKTYFAQDASGNIMPGATVMVYEAATTTLATGLQDESGSPLSNPFTADSSAKVAFYAPDGLYDITVVGNGRTVTIRAQFVSVDGASVLRSDLAAPGGSALVGFQQAGTGAVARATDSKLRESVSVKDFGAVGDGVTDDTSSIQAAMNACAAINAPLYLNQGTYKVSGTLTLTHFNAVVRGAGMERSVIVQTNAALSTPTLRTDPAITRNWSGLMSDFAVRSANGANNAAVQINNPNRRHCIERVRVDCASGETSNGVGIHILRTSGDALVDGYFTSARHCWVEKHADGYLVEGQVPGNANLHWLEYCTATNCSGRGAYFKNSTSGRVVGGHYEICGIGVLGENAADLQVLGGVYFERNATHDIHHVSGDAPKFIGNRHNSSAYSGGAGRAIRVDAGEFPQIQANTFYEGFSSFDIEIGASVGSAVIIDNVTKLRDISGGWLSSGPRVSDSGSGTIIANPQRTTGGARRYLFEKGGFYGKTFTLERQKVAQVNGTAGTDPEILAGSNNPNASSGTSGPAGSVYQRVGGTVQLYHKQSASDTDWAMVWTFLGASAAYDPPSIAAGGSASTTVAVAGAAMGDFVDVSFSLSRQGVIFYGEVTAAGTVTVRLYNPTAGAVDLGSGTIRVRVSKG